MWLLATLTARTRTRPKHREYAQPLAHKPKRSVLEPVLQKPGNQGGCNAQKFDWEENMKDMIDDPNSSEDIKWTPDELCTQIDADVEGMKLYMRRATKHRLVPSNSAPL